MIEKLVLGEIWTGDLPIFNPDVLTSAPSWGVESWGPERKCVQGSKAASEEEQRLLGGGMLRDNSGIEVRAYRLLAKSIMIGYLMRSSWDREGLTDVRLSRIKFKIATLRCGGRYCWRGLWLSYVQWSGMLNSSVVVLGMMVELRPGLHAFGKSVWMRNICVFLWWKGPLQAGVDMDSVDSLRIKLTWLRVGLLSLYCIL